MITCSLDFLLHGTGITVGKPLRCEEFFIGLDSAFPLAEDCGVRGLDVPEKIEDLADWLHLPVGYLAIEWGSSAASHCIMSIRSPMVLIARPTTFTTTSWIRWC